MLISFVGKILTLKDGLYMGTLGMLIAVSLLLFCVAVPCVITYKEVKCIKDNKPHYVLDASVVGLGYFLSYFELVFLHNVHNFSAFWHTQLYNEYVHPPLDPESWTTFFVLCGVGIVGYLILSATDVNKTPPLVTVLGMSAMFIGTCMMLAWGLQVFPDLFLIMVPVNVVLINVRIVRNKVLEYEIKEEETKLQRFLNKSKRWPLYAFVLMFPLLGICIGILVLFGQRPDAAIRAFTETSEWNLSMHEAPQNLYVDEHYLCTVAAGGHKAVVKPLRKGLRHGHEVIVNRQLCIANAFEQVLEEKTPRFHKRVRHFYDTYGFPIAKLIRTKWMADIVYFLMKPLEYFFLFVLYLVDVNPENRIAVQYTK